MSEMLFDTHAHYDDKAYDADREALLESLPGKGVGLVLNAGCCIESSKRALKLAEEYGHVYAATGTHPHEADSFTEDWLDYFEKYHPKRAAIGEIGLDYVKSRCDKETQKRVFAAHMELAEKLKLPVIIHDREAHKDTLDIVRSFKNVKGVFHCYSGSLETAGILVELGYYIGITGVITFKNAHRLAEVAAWLPEERILLETDCPYMAPEPYRGKRNDSSLLSFIAEKLASIRGVTAERIVEITAENGRRLFDI